MSRFVLLVSVILLGPGAAYSQWTQFGGPGRNFVSGELTIAGDGSAPLVLWKRELGPGYSGVVTDGERLITMTRSGEDEVVVALDPGSGRTQWRQSYPAPISESEGVSLDTTWGSGPNGTPLLVGDRVVTLGFTGALHCLDTSTGKKLWSHDLVGEYGIALPFFGLSTSPIQFDDLVIVIAGGAHAFRLATGELVWKNDEFEASYASPVLLETDRGPQLIAGVAGAIVGLDPRQGELLWRHEHSNDHRTILSSPVVGADDLVFVSAYFLGSVGLRLAPDGLSVRELWENSQIQLSYTNAIRDRRIIFGFHNSFLKAVDLETGRQLWQRRGLDRGNLVRIGERYLLLDRKGKLSLLSLDESGPTVHGEAQILEGRSWTAPALQGSTLYARNLEEIVAVDLSRAGGVIEHPASVARAPGIRAPEPFLNAKRRLHDAILRSEREAVAAAGEAFEPWAESSRPKELTRLARYYLGFGAYHEALLAEDDEALSILRRAEEHLVVATTLDDRFADAYALLGRIITMYYRYDPERAAIVGPLGPEHTETALRLEPNNPRVLAFGARSTFYRPEVHGGDHEVGLAMMRRALDTISAGRLYDGRAEPDWGRAILWVWYGEMLQRSEDSPQNGQHARKAFERALEIAPQYERARSLLKRATEQD